VNYLCVIPHETCTSEICDGLDVRFVYILQCEESLRFKIGVADDVDRRIGEIQRMCATQLNLIAVYPGKGHALEGYFHRRYAKYRIHGEWFEPDDWMIEDINSMSELYKNQELAMAGDLACDKKLEAA
jgi:hypothetical protein